MSHQELKKLVNQINKLKKDEDRIKFVMEYKDVFMFLLDNDDTQIAIIDDHDNPNYDEDGDYTSGLEVNGLDDYLGDSDGVFNLLDVLGIRADGV